MPLLEGIKVAERTQRGVQVNDLARVHETHLDLLIEGKSCLPAIESVIHAGRRQAFSFYEQVKVRYVDPREIAHLDPGLRSFRNFNTFEEWHSALDENVCSATLKRTAAR